MPSWLKTWNNATGLSQIYEKHLQVLLNLLHSRKCPESMRDGAEEEGAAVPTPAFVSLLLIFRSVVASAIVTKTLWNNATWCYRCTKRNCHESISDGAKEEDTTQTPHILLTTSPLSAAFLIEWWSAAVTKITAGGPSCLLPPPCTASPIKRAAMH